MHSSRILLLSDGSEIFSALDRFFTGEGYQTLTESHHQGVVEGLRRGEFPLVITRVRRNHHEPLSWLKSIRRCHPQVTAIILRGEHEVNSPIEAYQVQDGAEVFIPCGWPGLRRLVANCLGR